MFEKQTFESFFSEATKYVPNFHVKNSFDGETSSLILLVSCEKYKEELLAFDKKYTLNTLLAIESRPEFKGKVCESVNIFPVSEKIKRIFVISIGSESEFCIEKMQQVGAKISNVLNGFELTGATLLPLFASQNHSHCLAEVCFSLALRNYRFDKYFFAKKEGKGAVLKNIAVVCESVSDLEKEIDAKIHLAKHVMLVRDLVNAPASDIHPENYSKMISEAFDNNVKVTVLDEPELERLGCGSLLAVGRASSRESKMVVMEYRGNPDKSEIELAIVGKGVCYDSGGLSIKPAGSMEDMKIDMAGSAVSFSTLLLVAKLGLKVNIVGVVGLVENMISGSAYKPGDVLKSMSGQTIEVLNTDAEGRLVLADCLYYTQEKFAPKYMIDLATLTGAVTVALADVYCGLMANDDEICDKLGNASEKSCERLWRLPMGKEYDKMIDSTIADMKNVGSGRGAGTITAAQFLGRFVNCKDGWKTKWAHLDIAGVAYDGKGGADVKVSKGATGFGVNLLLNFIKNL